MIYTKLGRTGLDCSRLAFGTWQIGGGRWKKDDKEAALELLRHSKEVGVNLFDVAAAYGQYRGTIDESRSHALELLGEAFEGKERQEILICLKLGQLDEYSHRANYDPHVLVNQLRQCLRQLRTDYVDICLVHAPSIEEVREGLAISVVRTMQALGLVRYVGYSFEAEPKHAELAIEQSVDVIMVQYNLIDTECENTFALAQDKGVGLLVGGPFKRGYLSGQFQTADDLPLEDDYWAWNLRYSRKKVEDVLQIASNLKEKAGGARALRRLGVQRILRDKGASAAIVGHRSKQEVDDNAKLVSEIFEQS